MYIHIPFCKQLCSYCDFYFSVSMMRKNEMLDCLIREMEIKASKGERLSRTSEPYTLYFGGGTPTVYSAGELRRLSERAIELFFPAQPEEITVEANPDDLTAASLRQLADTGVNRLSIGIQSFINRDLKTMRRRHTAQQAVEAVENAQNAGFDNISIDLIYGFPGTGEIEWEYSLDQAIKLNVKHISAYHLSIENKTIIGKMRDRGEFRPVDEETSDAQYKTLENKLRDAGYRHYEISNFAIPGFESKHNSAYWNKQQYIGAGPSAHSYDGRRKRTDNVANNIKYIESLKTGIIPETIEILSDKDAYNETMIVALRTAEGLNPNDIPATFADSFARKTAKYLASGRMIFDGNYKIPSQYFLISDSIIRECIES